VKHDQIYLTWVEQQPVNPNKKKDIVMPNRQFLNNLRGLRQSLRSIVFVIFLLAWFGQSANGFQEDFVGKRVSFNDGWKFHKGSADGAEAVSYVDDDWRDLDLPHDWAIEGPFDVKYNARCGGLPFHGTG
jgi:beta-galactosidase